LEIRARVNGFLEQRLYTEGTMVKAGQVLFRMDQKPFKAALDAAMAELAQQQARLTTAPEPCPRAPLAAKNALSQKDLDDSVGQEQGAAAAVEQAKANVTNARLNLDYTTITAPVSGLSSYAKKQVGSYIDASNSLLTYVAKLDPIWVNFSLSENEVLQYQSQQASGQLKMPPRGSMEVEIVLADGATYGKRGHITFADASFSSETGTYLLRAEFPNTEGALRRGSSCASACLARSARAITVPQAAVVQGQRGQFVWTVGKDNKAETRVVDVGEWAQGNWIIRSGLREGDTVVVDGTVRLAPARPSSQWPRLPARVHRTAAWPPGAAPTPASAPTAAPEKGDVMKLSHFFIDRPIFASVLSIIIVVGGLVAMVNLPIAQFPDITPPTITVTTTYPGASSDVVAQNVAAPIEQQVNGADNMLYMSSTSSSTGNMTLTVYFEIGTDPSLAQVDVQNRVNLALPTLPDAVTKQGVSVQKRSSAFMMVIAVYSPDNSYPQTFVDNFTNIYILDALKRIPGANQASIFGTPDYAMRIWLKPDRMAQLASPSRISRTRWPTRTSSSPLAASDSHPPTGRSH
jgi:membrane fusion protein (multidrug efflux system)